jgi:hypothetical protein
VTKKLRRLFPKLFGGEYRLRSRKTRRYNCIAWAADHNNQWWQAPPDGRWPSDVPDDGTVEAVIHLFEYLGYTRTQDARPEKDTIKVAIYGDALGWTHTARQLPGDRGWTSKIGKLQDIEHDTLDSLSGSDYGEVLQIMKKKVVRKNNIPSG